MFNSSGAGTLRQALNLRDRRKRVVDFSDDLSWGPIAREDFGARQAWLNKSLPWDASPDSIDEGWDWIADEPQNFLSKLAHSNKHLVWVAPQNAKELCGLHWYIDHFGGEKASFIFVDQGIPGSWNGKAPQGLGELYAEQFQYLLANAERQAWDQKRHPKGHWAKLCNDATNLRVAMHGTAISVSDNFFDDLILQYCSPEWGKLMYVVGEAMITLRDASYSVGDSFLKWRLRRLEVSGKIACSSPITYCPNFDEPILVRLI
jgi:hypothetical protein